MSISNTIIFNSIHPSSSYKIFANIKITFFNIVCLHFLTNRFKLAEERCFPVRNFFENVTGTLNLTYKPCEIIRTDPRYTRVHLIMTLTDFSCLYKRESTSKGQIVLAKPDK